MIGVIPSKMKKTVKTKVKEIAPVAGIMIMRIPAARANTLEIHQLQERAGERRDEIR
jgi:hypothetical protein